MGVGGIYRWSVRERDKVVSLLLRYLTRITLVAIALRRVMSRKEREWWSYIYIEEQTVSTTREQYSIF